MLELRRTVRLNVNPRTPPSKPGRNGFAGKPPMQGLGRHYGFEAVCVGEPDATTGYLINIKQIDASLRAAIESPLYEACEFRPETDPQTLISDFATRVSEALAPVVLRRLVWKLTPTYALEALMYPETDPRTQTQTDVATRVFIRQRFDFAAAHRLHVPTMSDQENRDLFGRCNNPNGHGHNYQVEPCVSITPGAGFSLADLEQITDATIIDPFDHKHLNEDTDQFRTGSGLIPTVENIARVFYGLLAPEIEAHGSGATLASLTVWETDRTSCTYPASPASPASQPS